MKKLWIVKTMVVMVMIFVFLFVGCATTKKLSEKEEEVRNTYFAKSILKKLNDLDADPAEAFSKDFERDMLNVQKQIVAKELSIKNKNSFASKTFLVIIAKIDKILQGSKFKEWKDRAKKRKLAIEKIEQSHGFKVWLDKGDRIEKEIQPIVVMIEKIANGPPTTSVDAEQQLGGQLWRQREVVVIYKNKLLPGGKGEKLVKALIIKIDEILQSPKCEAWRKKNEKLWEGRME